MSSSYLFFVVASSEPPNQPMVAFLNQTLHVKIIFYGMVDELHLFEEHFVRRMCVFRRKQSDDVTHCEGRTALAYSAVLGGMQEYLNQVHI